MLETAIDTAARTFGSLESASNTSETSVPEMFRVVDLFLYAAQWFVFHILALKSQAVSPICELGGDS